MGDLAQKIGIKGALGQGLGKRLIGQVLIEMGAITPERLASALKESSEKKVRLGEYLVKESIITDVQLAKALAVQYDLEYLDLNVFQPSAEALKHVPEKIARRFVLLPVSVTDNVLTIAVFDPLDILKLDVVRKVVKIAYVIKVSPHKHILAALEKCYSSVHSMEGMVQHLAKSEIEAKPGSPVAPSNISTDDVAATPSIESLVNKTLDRALADGASDIHFDPAEDKVRIRMRIDGVLHDVLTYPLELHPSTVSRLKIISQLDIAEKRQAQDGRFQYVSGGRAVDIRISTLPTIKGEKAVLRVLDKSKLKGKLVDLGMNPEMAARISSLLRRPYGIIFVTGPTGSGKTTSLYSMLTEINDPEKNIITVEDPVEFRFDLINQVQVNEKAHLGFAGILRNILRQDPDVIMIGEVRDIETADIAVRASLTGHLVLTTLHTNDAISTISRLMDMEIEPFLLSPALLGVLAQRLVRVLCTECRKPSANSNKLLALLGQNCAPAGATVYQAQGCEKCHHSGYLGRTPIYELMVVDSYLQRAINAQTSEAEILAHLKANGFKAMRDDGIQKVLSGITTVEEVVKATF